VPILIKYLSVCKDQDYFEKGLEMAIQNGLKVTPIDISDLNCIEIDFPEDLDAANNMIDNKGIIKDLK
jgi:choline kinase